MNLTMTLNRSTFFPKDCGYVDVRCTDELRYWAKELACTEEQVRVAVANVGPLVVDVKQFIGKNLAG